MNYNLKTKSFPIYHSTRGGPQVGRISLQAMAKNPRFDIFRYNYKYLDK